MPPSAAAAGEAGVDAAAEVSAKLHEAGGVASTFMVPDSHTTRRLQAPFQSHW